jgi:hypothetical protein
VADSKADAICKAVANRLKERPSEPFPELNRPAERDSMQVSAAHHHVHGARHAAPTGGAGKAAPAEAPAAAAAPAAVVSISSKAQSAYAAAHAGGDADHDGDKK